MRVLVTGAFGYIGTATVAALQRAGHHPVALQHRPASPAGVETYTGDVLAPESLAAPLAGVDAVCHLAGICCTSAMPPRPWSQPSSMSLRWGGRGGSISAVAPGRACQDIVAAAECVTGRHIPVVHRPAADEPPELVADPRRAEAELGWKPQRSTLDEILTDAWTAEHAS